MFNKDSLIKISTMRENERQTVELMKDADGKKYLKRHIHSDKRKIYRKFLWTKRINSSNRWIKIYKTWFIGRRSWNLKKSFRKIKGRLKL